VYPFSAEKYLWLPLPGYYLPLELLTTVVVAHAAPIGGFLSGVNIPG
jgi:hypothetical protein